MFRGAVVHRLSLTSFEPPLLPAIFPLYLFAQDQLSWAMLLFYSQRCQTLTLIMEFCIPPETEETICETSLPARNGLQSSPRVKMVSIH